MSNHKTSPSRNKGRHTITKERNGGRNSNDNDMACGHDDNNIDQQSLLHQLHIVTSWIKNLNIKLSFRSAKARNTYCGNIHLRQTTWLDKQELSDEYVEILIWEWESTLGRSSAIKYSFMDFVFS